jgi:hypothetical protein
MKNKSKKSRSDDPLAEELNFEKLEIVAYGPGWKKKPQRLRGPKSLSDSRAKVGSKSTSSKSGRRAA